MLLEQFRSNQKYLLDENTLPCSIAEAYAVQAEYQGALSQSYCQMAGYKVAYTTVAVQQESGLTEPCDSVMLANNIRHSPAILDSSDFLQVRIECEVARSVGGKPTGVWRSLRP